MQQSESFQSLFANLKMIHFYVFPDASQNFWLEHLPTINAKKIC